MRKSFSTFVKEDFEYTAQWLVKRGQIQAANQVFSTIPYRLPKKTGWNRKSQVHIKLGESFYLPYLDSCKSQNVPVTIYCKFDNELGVCRK